MTIAAPGRSPVTSALGGAGDETARLAPMVGRWLGSLARNKAVTVAALAVTTGVAEAVALTRHQIDFGVYFLGGRDVFGPNLYSTAHPGTGLFFTYPPFAALLFAPVARMPLLLAEGVSAAVNVAALIVLGALALKAVRPRMDRREALGFAALASVMLAALRPVFDAFLLGQVELVLAVLVLADLTRRWKIGSWTLPRGVLIGIAAAVKLTPLLFVPYLLLTRQKRAAAVASATFVMASALGAVAAPSASLTFWTRGIFRARSGTVAYYISDQNLRAFLLRLYHGPVPASLLWGVTFLTAAAGLVIAGSAYRRSSELLGVLLCATTALLVSPISWDHHYVWVVPALAWLAFAADRPARGRQLAAGIAVLFIAAPIWWVPHLRNDELHEGLLQLVVGNSFFFMASLFVLGVALMLLVRRRLGTGRTWSPVDEPALLPVRELSR